MQMEDQISKATVVGAGIMGHGVAQLLAQNGVEVCLIDTSAECLERARSWIRDNLDYMVQLELLDAGQVRPILARISYGRDFDLALHRAGYVLEAVTEDFELKRRIWADLSAAADPEAILASNTSSYDIDALTAGVRGPERVIGTHWFNPPQITPCVEVIPASAASDHTVQRTLGFLRTLGKAPTLCRSAPGFVANRLQFALAREAIALVEEGLATPAEVDRIVKTSFGFRLSAYGPFEVADQAGIDTYLRVFEYLHSKLAREDFRPPEILRRLVADGKLGLKSAAGFYDYGAGVADRLRRERDRKLYARLQLARQEWQEDDKETLG